jgi:dimethylargininase
MPPARTYTHAITRSPGRNFAEGITTSTLGAPDIELAARQHAAYCDVLRRLGVSVTTLPPDPRYPDGCFVEDTAIVTERGTIITNPGDRTRSGEVAALERALVDNGQTSIVARITAPGTVDGGDVLRIENAFYIGFSQRTNAAGAQELASALERLGFKAHPLGLPRGLLHLKTGVTYIGDDTLILIPELAECDEFSVCHKIIPLEQERYAANTLTVNGTTIMPAGHPITHRAIEEHGVRVIETPMTEFQKMDGGLTCLSLVW